MILAIYGSCGLGLDVLDIALKINSISQKWEKIIFIDDISQEKNKYGYDIFSYEEQKKIFPKKDIEFIIAIGEPSIRETMYQKIIHDQYTLTTIIHPHTDISFNVQIGKGCILFYSCYIANNSIIEDNCVFLSHTVIEHNSIIGQSTVFASGAKIAGNCKIGKCCFLGVNSAVKEKITIGDNTIIGLGSSVYKNLNSNTILYGTIAKKIEEKIQIFK